MIEITGYYNDDLDLSIHQVPPEEYETLRVALKPYITYDHSFARTGWFEIKVGNIEITFFRNETAQYAT
jgi:hypothetical protein